MKDKFKRQLIVFSSLILIALLVVMIIGKFKKAEIIDISIPEKEEEKKELFVEEIKDIELSIKEDKPSTKLPEEEEKIEDKDLEVKEVGQKLQEDVEEKPIYTKEQLEDPSQTPDGQKVEPPKKEEEEVTKDKPKKSESTKKADKKAEKKAEPTKKPSKDKKKEPEENFPGFGYVPDSGPNRVDIVDSDGDINKQVGIMD